VALRDFAMLGIVLGFAALTKATFLPVVAAAFIVLAIRALMAWRTERFASRLSGVSVSGLGTALIGSWWYVMQLFSTGNVIGSNDLINMQASEGLLPGFARNVTLSTVLRAPWDLATSFLWGGTWSFVLPPRWMLLPLVLMVGVIAYGCYRMLRARSVATMDAFALLALGLFVAALIYHSIIFISLVGNVSPAWYLHSLAPILVLLVGPGIMGAMSIGWLRGIVPVLLVYPLVFLPMATALAVLYFAGCAPLLEGRRYFSLASAAACVANYPRMHDNLSVIAYPAVGIPLFAAGWLLLVIAVIAALCLFRAQAATPPLGKAMASRAKRSGAGEFREAAG
jgi:hypothetical protein